MRTIRLGDRQVEMTGSALTPFFYAQEFGRPLTLDSAFLASIETPEQVAELDDVFIITILRIVWAMEKTTELGRLTDFQSWLVTLGEQVDLLTPLDQIKAEVLGATAYVASDTSTDKGQSSQYSYELSLIVIAKKIGFSFQELNALSLQDLMDVVDIWTDAKADAPRKATQEDIDNFYSM